MVIFFLRKLILQMRMRSHPVGLDVWSLVSPFVYFHTSYVRTMKALARQRRCAGLPEPSLVAYVISTIISWAGSYMKNNSIFIKLSVTLCFLEEFALYDQRWTKLSSNVLSQNWNTCSKLYSLFHEFRTRFVCCCFFLGLFLVLLFFWYFSIH